MVALVLDGLVGFPAGLSPTSFHLSPSSFHLSGLSPTSFHLSPRLGACGRVPGRLVSHFLFFSFVSHFFSFVSQAGCLWSRLACLPPSFHSRCLWSGSRLACLPLPFICLPGWVLVVEWSPWCWRVPGWLVSHFLHLSPTSCHFSPKLGACGSHFLSFVSHFFSFVSQFFSFVSQAGCLWSGLAGLYPIALLLFICLPVLFICLPRWVLVVGFPAGLSPTSFRLFFGSFHLSPKLGACGRVPGWLVSHFLSFVSHFFSFVSQFFSFVSQAGCLWSGSRLACLPLPFICLPLLFICPGWALVVEFAAGLSPTFFHLSPTSFYLSFVSQFFFPQTVLLLGVLNALKNGRLGAGFPAGLSPTSFHLSPTSCHLSPKLVLVVGFPAGLSPTSFHLSPTSFRLSPSFFHLSPRLGACGRFPGWLVSHFLYFFSYVFQFFSFVSQAGCLWSGSPAGLSPTSFHSPNSLLLGVLNALKNGRLGAGWSGRVPGRLVSHFPPKQFTVRGSQFFLEMCPPFVSLLVSAH